MAGYTKLFPSIIHSTIWREANHVRLVWVTMLAMADRDGLVESSVPGLADAARVTIRETEDALSVLSSPDPYSRSPEDDGRRVREAPGSGGWILVNYEKYREKADLADRRAKAAARQKRKRERDRAASERHAESVTDPGMSRPVTHRHQKSRQAAAAATPSAAADPPKGPPAGAVPAQSDLELESPDPKPDDVRRVWQCWLNHHGEGRRLKLTDSRRKFIQGRLNDDIPVERLEAAIRGTLSDPHMMGHGNAGSTVYREIANIFRNADRVERLARLDGQPRSSPSGAMEPSDFSDLPEDPLQEEARRQIFEEARNTKRQE